MTGASQAIGPAVVPYSAADISEVCRGFIGAHCAPPEHIHGDLFARCSRSALEDLAMTEQAMVEALEEADEKEKDKD